MEKLHLRIYYFDKESFLESYSRWKQGFANIPGQHISPLELSWNHFFKVEIKECIILDKFEFKCVNKYRTFSNQSFWVLEDDLLWLESIPSYENGSYVSIKTKNLFSVRSLKETSDTYKITFKDKYKNNFGEDWFLDEIFPILNREMKLKELGIF